MRKGFTLVDLCVDVYVEASDDAGGLGFDLDLGNGLDLAGGDDGTGNVSELSRGDLGGVDLVVARESFGCNDAATDEHKGNDGQDNPEALAGFAGRIHSGLLGRNTDEESYARNGRMVPLDLLGKPLASLDLKGRSFSPGVNSMQIPG